MNKTALYIVLALAGGLLLGYLFFAGSKDEHSPNASANNSDSETEMWTCSMHPQIMQPEAGNCPICGMELIPADQSMDMANNHSFSMTENAMALANIQTTIVEGNSNGNANNEVVLSGKVVTNEEDNSVQISYFTGRIEKLYVSFTGESLKAGQLLATIYSPELFSAQQELLTAAELKNSQPDLYKAVRNKLKIWKLSDKQIDAIEASGKVQQNLPIYATVSGTVTEKLVSEGDQVSQGQVLLKVSNLNSVWADFDVYENQIPLFEKGQGISITTNANPNKTYNAKVSFIDPMLNPNTRTTVLRAELENKNGELKPGMFVKGTMKVVAIPTESHNITVPETAVLWTGKRSVVYVKTDPNAPQFEMREISLGSKLGERYQVLEGLSAGEEIVTNGTFTVDAAAQLQGKPSMMNMSATQNSKETSKKFNEIDIEFQDKLYQLVSIYLELKTALVSSNSDKANIHAAELAKAIEIINTSNLKTEEAKTYLTSRLEQCKTSANNIAKTNNLDGIRTLFKPLSENLIAIVKAFRTNHTIYEQFCPMADNNKGGYWLSLEKEIRNPYFGEAMLNCGEVMDTLN